MRAAAFLDAGGYEARYFIGAEESLLSLDLAARGWQLWYCEDLIVRHHPSPLDRDPESRRRLVLRNRLWTVLLRLSATSAWRTVFEYAAAAPRDALVRRALMDALRGLPWVLRARHPVPGDLERRVLAVGLPAP
jgi:GT2 family glycosyltransferase